MLRDFAPERVHAQSWGTCSCRRLLGCQSPHDLRSPLGWRSLGATDANGVAWGCRNHAVAGDHVVAGAHEIAGARVLIACAD